MLPLAVMILDDTQPMVHRYFAFALLASRISFDQKNKTVTVVGADRELWMSLDLDDRTLIYKANQLNLPTTTGATNVQSDG